MPLIPASTPIEMELECGACGHRQAYEFPTPACQDCGHDWMEVRYDYERISKLWHRILSRRPFTMWRYRELLPLRNDEHQISMGEGGTELLRARNLGMMLGIPNLFIKDERQNPTNSFKDRQASLVISMMKEADITEFVVASTGNVAIAYSAYAAHAGIKLWTFLPSLVPAEKMREIAIYGSEVIKVTDTYDATKKVAARFADHKGIIADRGIRDVGSRESMKTMALEIAEQLTREFGPPRVGATWQTPDWYVQAVAGGMGPIGFWKGYQELCEMGFVDRMPKLALIQAEGCAPMVSSYNEGLASATPVVVPTTRVITIATGQPGKAYEHLYSIVTEHGGAFEAVSDQETFRALHLLAKLEGLSVEPAAAAAFAGVFSLISRGVIKRHETVVVNCSGHTLPVEKFLLDDDWAKVITTGTRYSESERPSTTAEPDAPGSIDILGALDRLDRRVRRIAIIEDNLDAARLLRRILQTRGDYQITEAHTGAAGLEIIRREQPDVVLLDLMMPDMDGFAILEKLRADHARAAIPVIVVTAKALSQQDRERLEGQIDMLLQKGSFMDDDLLQGIEAVLGKTDGAQT